MVLVFLSRRFMNPRRESLKAVDAAISSRQWKKAVDILATQDPELAIGYYKKIADHFSSIQEYDVSG